MLTPKSPIVRETLEEMISDAQQTEASLLHISEDLANHDDRELSNTGKLVSELGYNSGESILVQTDKLCAALAGFSIDNIKCRLTRVYLATVYSAQENCNASSIRHDDMEGELRAEVDSLYDEIVPLTEMSIGRNISQLCFLFLCLSVNILIRKFFSPARQRLHVLTAMILKKINSVFLYEQLQPNI